MEERVYRNDPKVRAIDMMFMESVWKNLILWVTIPLFASIPLNTDVNSSGVLENPRDAIFEVLQNKTLLNLLIS